MLSGHDQAEEEIVTHEGQKFVEFYGMSSDTAMKRHKGGVAEYRASEGKTVRVPYRGDVSVALQDILGGLRSACTYVGARQLKELSKRATFIRVTQQLNSIFQ
jgi:GMP reductase